MRQVCTAQELVNATPDGAWGLIATDPPWLLQGGGRFEAVADYALQPVSEILDTLGDARRCLTRGGFLYLFAPSGPEGEEVIIGMAKRGWTYQRQLAWRKGKTGLGAWQSAHEPVLIYTNGPSRGYEISGRYPSILDWPRPAGRTAKPWQAYRAFLEMSSRPGELVADPWCGTNPLEAACASLQPGRRWVASDVLTAEQVHDAVRTSDTVRKQSRRRQVATQGVLA